MGPCGSGRIFSFFNPAFWWEVKQSARDSSFQAPTIQTPITSSLAVFLATGQRLTCTQRTVQQCPTTTSRLVERTVTASRGLPLDRRPTCHTDRYSLSSRHPSTAGACLRLDVQSQWMTRHPSRLRSLVDITDIFVRCILLCSFSVLMDAKMTHLVVC